MITINKQNDNKITLNYLGLNFLAYTEKGDGNLNNWMDYDKVIPKIDDDGIFHGSYFMKYNASFITIPVRLKTYEEGFSDCFGAMSHDPFNKWQDHHYLYAG